MSSWIATTEYAETLGMGDRYKLTEHGEIVTVGWVDDTVDGGCWIRVEGAVHQVFQACTRVYIVSRAPRCNCGKRYENCENECEWPVWAEDLFMGRVADVPAV